MPMHARLTIPLLWTTMAAHADACADHPPRPLSPEPTPYTIEPGRFAIEIDAVNYTRNRRGGITTTALEWPVTLRLGILDNFEFQAQIEAFVWERTQNTGRDTSSGFGNVYLRPKLNLWGNHRGADDTGGRTAMAVMPFIKLPTDTHGLGNDAVEGGITLPWDMDLTDRLSLEITPELGVFRDAPEGAGYHLESAMLLSLHYEATDSISVLGEFLGAVSAEPGSHFIGVFRTGLTFDLDPHTVIEPVIAFGLTPEADDYNFTLTLARRF